MIHIPKSPKEHRSSLTKQSCHSLSACIYLSIYISSLSSLQPSILLYFLLSFLPSLPPTPLSILCLTLWTQLPDLHTFCTMWISASCVAPVWTTPRQSELCQMQPHTGLHTDWCVNTGQVSTAWSNVTLFVMPPIQIRLRSHVWVRASSSDLSRRCKSSPC